MTALQVVEEHEDLERNPIRGYRLPSASQVAIDLLLDCWTAP